MADKRPAPGNGTQYASSKRARPNNDVHGHSRGTSDNDMSDAIARAKARAAELTARLNKPSSTASAPAQTGPEQSRQERAAFLRAKIAASAANRNGIASARESTNSSSRSSPPPPPPLESEQQPASEQSESVPKSRGGLSIGLHPALLNDAPLPQSKAKTQQKQTRKPKQQLDLSGPSIEELKKNPYFDSSISGASAGPRNRKSKTLVFSQHGKYMQQAASLRRQAQLEEMKRQIAEKARKAGLKEDRTEQSFLIVDVPDCEWWDEGLVTDSRYPDFNEDAMEAERTLKIYTDDSIITRYVQHPVLIAPPQEKKAPELKALPLTKKEMAKKRRQERSEKLKEKQAKVRLGLLPPDPPKVRMQTMMRILGEEAVRDPTAMEARVRQEVESRQLQHQQDNAERKLTKEERHEKLASNQVKDAGRGIYMNVYRIETLAFGGHRYKIDINAKQHALTGITILNPAFNLVVVEGGEHSIKKFKKLMLNRINWSENAPMTETAHQRQAESKQDDPIARVEWLRPTDESGALKDLSANRCQLVWEGEVRDRIFKIWRNRVCETEAEAKGVLERSKMENMWQLAKTITG